MNGPPERERRPGGNRAADSLATDASIITAREVARLSRRGRALLECSHIGDPHAGCHRCGRVSDRQAEAAVTAVQHLDEHGLPALLDRATCAAVWKLGHRDLAAEVYRRTAGVL